MTLILKPPQCYHCGQLLEWENITCPRCSMLTPHLGNNWNKPINLRKWREPNTQDQHQEGCIFPSEHQEPQAESTQKPEPKE
jgi:hypothetical protein